MSKELTELAWLDEDTAVLQINGTDVINLHRVPADEYHIGFNPEDADAWLTPEEFETVVNDMAARLGLEWGQ